MGLSNASQLFQRAMEVALKGLLGFIVMLYIYDMMIYSQTENELLKYLAEAFNT